MSMDGVAIVGMAGRFPGAGDVDAFWSNIKNGVESITHFSPSELDIPAESMEQDPNARFVCAKGILDGVDMFDARFFGYLPREAELMDPQHRVFLELCSDAIEHAGYDAQRYPGAIGVYGGCYMDTYLMWNLCSDPKFLARFIESIQVGSLQTELGNDKDYLATRVAFKLGLRGPAMTLQTACSTSLVAIATACQAVASYQCDMALAGGVTIVLPQKKGYFYKEGSMLSPDGHCRTFDEQAAGTVFSNGAAVLLLKRVEDAIADGDTIYAVIRGYATNNDGAGKVSYTAPSVDGQAEVISMALSMADIDARTIGYVEAHGTATPMGDPIEVAGLTTAYRAYGPDTGYCAIGSVKANLGHLDIASGAIGLIKTTLSLHEAVLPPSINFTRPNPKIDFAASPFYVNTQLRPWPERDFPRRAGVSSFGVGGTNAHVIVEQAPDRADTGPGRSHSLLVLSARSESALAAQARRLADFLESRPGVLLEDVAHTLQVGRRQFEHRRIVVASTNQEAIAALRKDAAPGETSQLRASAPKVTFMFPGQGAQYPGMARQLYDAEPVFRAAIDRCCAALSGAETGAQDPRPYLLWNDADSELDNAKASLELSQTRIAQPALFAMEMALVELLKSWGVKPDAVMGHSVGEFAAACAAGVFEMEEAMQLVALRGRLMQAQPEGRMLAVRAPAEALQALLPEGVAIAAINAPNLSVASGPSEAVAALAERLAREDIQATALVTSHAYHSSMMQPAREPLTEAVRKVPRKPAMLRVVSTATGTDMPADGFCDPEYWGSQLMSPVRFSDGVAAATQDGSTLLEVGPGRTLTGLARQTVARSAAGSVLPCLGPVQAPGKDVHHLLVAIGQLWLAGANPDWNGLQSGTRRRIALPTYPFERKRFWVEPPARGAKAPEPSVGALDQAASSPALTSDAGRPAPDDVEWLIRQQLALIQAQISAMGKSGSAGE